MDFQEKSQHYFRIAFAMKEAGKSDEAIEKYLNNEELDPNEIFLILDRLDETPKGTDISGTSRPQKERKSKGSGGVGRKILGVPLKIIGGVFVVLGIGLVIMKLIAGDEFDRGYIVAAASVIIGVVFFIQGRGS